MGLKYKYAFLSHFKKNVSVIKTHSLPSSFFKSTDFKNTVTIFLYGSVDSTVCSIIKLWERGEIDFIRKHLTHLDCNYDDDLDLQKTIYLILKAYIRQLNEWTTSEIPGMIYYIDVSELAILNGILKEYGLKQNLTYAAPSNDTRITELMSFYRSQPVIENLFKLAEDEYVKLSK